MHLSAFVHCMYLFTNNEKRHEDKIWKMCKIEEDEDVGIEDSRG